MRVQAQSDLKKLNKFVKGLSEKFAVRIGIFNNRTDRKETSEVDNAYVGLLHELGSFERNIPVRSWLVMPLRTSQNEIVRKASIGMVDLLAVGRIDRVLKDFGFACEDAILAAFKSGGFGTWKPLRPATVKRKGGSTAILIDTGQLRRAVASQVIKV